jgi:hypothetical protein
MAGLLKIDPDQLQDPNSGPVVFHEKIDDVILVVAPPIAKVQAHLEVGLPRIGTPRFSKIVADRTDPGLDELRNKELGLV